ncbi:MAG: type IV secretory system conjugative DNA transfer family protein [Lachnospiraceae bacterium]|nr:type IV secretory system conjugative DNA transfer family protein [Lachnospiraceae bacterium]
MQKKNKIEAANVMSDREYGTRILAKGCEVSEDSFKSRLNGNDLIVGGSGAGKTGSYVTPNLIRLMNSMVVADTKGLLVKKYGDYLRKKGFKVVCIDFVHPERSAHYNILDEVRWYETEAIDEEGKKVKKKNTASRTSEKSPGFLSLTDRMMNLSGNCPQGAYCSA